MNEFHIYLTFLRKRFFKDSSKFCKILGIDKTVWRKIENGINPPPKKSILSKFCSLTLTKEYEKNQLYALAKRWEPHPNTSTVKHSLWHKGMDKKWAEALINENTPDYKHKYW